MYRLLSDSICAALVAGWYCFAERLWTMSLHQYARQLNKIFWGVSKNVISIFGGCVCVGYNNISVPPFGWSEAESLPEAGDRTDSLPGPEVGKHAIFRHINMSLIYCPRGVFATLLGGNYENVCVRMWYTMHGKIYLFWGERENEVRVTCFVRWRRPGMVDEPIPAQ